MRKGRGHLYAERDCHLEGKGVSEADEGSFLVIGSVLSGKGVVSAAFG